MCITAPRNEDTEKTNENNNDAVEKKSVTEIIDDISIRQANVHKLLTKEDGRFGHIHKIIGSAALAHYIYRTYLVITTGSMQFDSSMTTLLCILLHAVLSISSFLFKIPNNRMKTSPMIYPEFRLHSIIFAYRSLIIMVLMWTSKRYDVMLPLYLSYKDQGTTMRANPMPAYISNINKDRLNMFYSICQILATSQVMFSYHLDEVFAVVFPIQIAALLMTMVRKSIITAGAWHYYYTLTLLSNFGVCICCMWNPPATAGSFILPSSLFIGILRFNIRGLNKYVLWGIVCLAQMYAMLVLNRYTSVII
mmetsp:Transcript_23383/g.22524  ORF Transcript_23383/g.22524 Transcript_23383/m.22524 type:complete len:307 (+) Transcript_23383:260-1180(+)